MCDFINRLLIDRAKKRIGVAVILLVISAFTAAAQQPVFESQLILPYHNEHVHASTIVQLPNGDLLAGWFEGSGERWADDVKIMGARKKDGRSTWSEPFILVDVEGFPDANPVLFLDNKKRLWLMWYTVIANQWETSLLKYRISSDYSKEGAPDWDWQADLHVKPGDKAEYGIQPGDSFVQSVKEQIASYTPYLKKIMDNHGMKEWESHASQILSKAKGEGMVRGGGHNGKIIHDDGTYTAKPLGYPYFRRMGWQTRNKPFITESGRIIVPLYSDGFSFSLMAYSDDSGETWKFSNPLVGFGSIQPAIAETGSGKLVAYMRDAGPPPKRLQVSHSTDSGETWSPVGDSNIQNPGAAVDIVTLENGDWVLIYNDTTDNRHSLAVAVSEDNGQTWPWKKKIEYDKENPSSIYAAYPTLIKGKNGELYATYSYHKPGSEEQNETIKFVHFNESWIKSK